MLKLALIPFKRTELVTKFITEPLALASNEAPGLYINSMFSIAFAGRDSK